MLCVVCCIPSPPLPPPLQGATDELIEALPTTTLTEDSELIKEGGDNTCPICLSDMVVGEKVRILHCKHFFHNTVTIIFIAGQFIDCCLQFII